MVNLPVAPCYRLSTTLGIVPPKEVTELLIANVAVKNNPKNFFISFPPSLNFKHTHHISTKKLLT